MDESAKQVTPEEIRAVTALLRRAYPYIESRKRAEGVLDEPPLDSLVRAILSQNTNDRNRDRAFAALRARFPDWNAVPEAPVDAVAEAIRATNYAFTKAQRIQAILTTLRAEHGTATLEFLRTWPTERTLAYLRGFPGVGKKSAAVVCLFALRRPVMPVDTHVHRVTRRLGWIGLKTSAERAHDLLQQLLPPALIFPLHMGLWEHGRVTCRPVPHCAQCAVYAYCIYAAKTSPEPFVDDAIAQTANERRAA